MALGRLGAQRSAPARLGVAQTWVCEQQLRRANHGAQAQGQGLLIRDTDGDEYQLKYWKEKNLEFFNFVVLTKTPQPPEWTHEKFFIIKTV